MARIQQKADNIKMLEETLANVKTVYPSQIYSMGLIGIEFDRLCAKRQKSTPKIIFTHTDTITAALKSVSLGKQPIIVNFASHKRPGGGVTTGATAQEEDVCRKTSLLLSLRTVEKSAYPLSLDTLISSTVHIIRGDDKEILKKNKQPTIGVITVAAIALNEQMLNLAQRIGYENLKLGKDGPLVVDIMQSKINGMFMLAAVLGYRTIIVGAFGCGAFHNPPQKVATYFKEAIDRYGHLFDEIVFAILTNNPAKNENYQAFYKAFH